MIDTASHVRQWLTQAALPLWSHEGLDSDGRGFVERLDLTDRPDVAAAKRLRVQARQIYVFSHAKLLGLHPQGDRVAAQGYEFVLRHGCPDGMERGFVHALDRDGRVVDARRDTYDHAFLLFAASWFYRATGDESVRSVILALDQVLQDHLRHPHGDGYAVDDRGGDARHQNPHMHLLEAVLAAYDATGDARFLDRASELFDLFRTRMFDPGPGVLREFYRADWQPADGEVGRIVEPGHHCEWVWLLKWYADRIGQPLCEEAYRLDTFVQTYGRPSDGVLLCDELSTDGSVRKSSTRSWPQTEAIKAAIALAEARGEPFGTEIDKLVDALFATFLGKPVAGGWIDWVDANGAPLVQAIPASTFYHVFLALAEYLRAKAA